MKILYTAEAEVEHGRSNGHARSSDGRLDVKLDHPIELGGSGGPGTNPEQLFAAGYGACFMGSVRFSAGKRKVDLPDLTVRSRVSMVLKPEGTYTLAVHHTVVMPGIDPVIATELLAAAHERCPYSNATRGNVEVTFEAAEA